MATLTIELDDTVLDAVQEAANREGNPVEEWIRHHLTLATSPTKGWPQGYFETIASFDDDTLEVPSEIPIPLDEAGLDTPGQIEA